MIQDNIKADTTDCVTPINYSFGPLKIKSFLILYSFITTYIQVLTQPSPINVINIIYRMAPKVTAF